MVEPISSSHSQPSLPFNSPTHAISQEDVAAYLEISRQQEVLTSLLSIAENKQLDATSGTTEPFSKWLAQRQENGFFAGMYEQAALILKNETLRVKDYVNDLKGEVKATEVDMQSLQQQIAHCKNPEEKKVLENDLGDLQEKYTDLKKELSRDEELRDLLGELKVVKGPGAATFSIQGPSNWQNLLAQLGG